MKTLTGYLYYPDSLAEADGITYFLVRSEEENQQISRRDEHPKPRGADRLAGFQDGQGIAGDSGATTHLFPLTPENAALLRERLPWLRPQPLGLCITRRFWRPAWPGHPRARPCGGRDWHRPDLRPAVRPRKCAHPAHSAAGNG